MVCLHAACRLPKLKVHSRGQVQVGEPQGMACMQSAVQPACWRQEETSCWNMRTQHNLRRPGQNAAQSRLLSKPSVLTRCSTCRTCPGDMPVSPAPSACAAVSLTGATTCRNKNVLSQNPLAHSRVPYQYTMGLRAQALPAAQ